MVFADFYPTNTGDFEACARALETLSLSDSSFSFEPVTSDALGFGFRCGFLGLLHMEIVQERLEREHDLDMIQTAPTVTYQIRARGRRGAGDPLAGAAALARPATRRSSSPTRASRSSMPAEYIGA